MPPSKVSCEIYKNIHEAYAIILDKWKTISDGVNTISGILSGLGSFALAILDSIFADLLSAAAAAASSVAQNVLGAISKSLAGMFEMFFAEILKILLIFPTATFSLVAIPHEQAITANERERKYLLRARANMTQIMRIISKWTDRQSGRDYYMQMKEALPLIEQALNIATYLLNSLNASEAGSYSRNAYFDKGRYDNMQALLARAIEITKPVSTLANKLNFERILADNRQKEYDRLASGINKRFDRDKKALATEHTRRSAALSMKGPLKERAQNVLELERLDSWYGTKLNALKTTQRNELSQAEVDADAYALSQRSTWALDFGLIQDEFWEDIKILGDQLSNLVENMKDAFIRYQESRVFCNNIYNMESIIRSIISQVISLLKASGNAASNVLIGAITTGAACMRVAKNTYEAEVEKYESPDIGATSTELASAVAFGNIALISGSNAMNAVVTDSLVNLVNSDEALSGMDDQFRQFMADLAAIEDWDGKTGVWAVDLIGGSLSPYVQSIADVTSMLTLVPILSLGGREKDQLKIQKLTRDVNDTFNSLFRHNAAVGNVLASYTPYSSTEIGNLKRILAAMGMLKNFAMAMNILSLVKELSGLVKIFPFSGSFPTYDECNKEYPGLMSNDMNKSIAIQRSNQPLPILVGTDMQASLEKGAIGRIGAVESRKNMNRHSQATKDLDNPEDALAQPSAPRD
jgi:hypothetical protein